MKKVLCILLSLLTALSLAACGKKEAETTQDTSPVTVLIGASGNSEAYFLKLQELIKTNLGIDIEFVYQCSQDATSMMRLNFANNDLPADIIFTASMTDSAILENSCIDLLGHTSMTARYTTATLKDCTTSTGKCYQLPISTKLIGITYNETLLNEMGWSVPKTFQDMVDLKAKCDEAGIKFAVTDGVAAGHGFNWLFHMMGAQWISTLAGNEWFDGYLSGTATIDAFKEQCDYFKRWTEAGLWGHFHNTDWLGSVEFQQTRALFLFSLTNSVSGYEGPQYDDEGNETGVMLKDTYKSMPWISESGANNLYTRYDNCWVLVNKKLEAADQAEKLEKVIKILELLTSDAATALVSEQAADTYVSLAGYKPDETRIYGNYADAVNGGYLQPWYYNSFDMDSIVFTGNAVNAYLAGTGAYEEIFTTLDTCNSNHLASKTTYLTNFPDGLNNEETAKLVALAGAAALDSTLEANGRTERVDVSLIPYTTWGGLPCWRGATVSNSIAYPGDFDASTINALIPTGATAPSAIRMTGKEIKEITEKGFDPADRFIDAATGKSTFDSTKYGPYPYAVVIKGGATLEDDKEYLVCVPDRSLTQAQYTAFSDAGKIITDLTDAATYNAGVTLFVNGRSEIKAADLVF